MNRRLIWVRTAPLGLARSKAASDPGLRTDRFARRPPPWAGLGVSLRDGSKNGVDVFVFTGASSWCAENKDSRLVYSSLDAALRIAEPEHNQPQARRA